MEEVGVNLTFDARDVKISAGNNYRIDLDIDDVNEEAILDQIGKDVVKKYFDLYDESELEYGSG